jgi:hypothetical protein
MQGPDAEQSKGSSRVCRLGEFMKIVSMHHTKNFFIFLVTSSILNISTSLGNQFREITLGIRVKIPC